MINTNLVINLKTSYLFRSKEYSVRINDLPLDKVDFKNQKLEYGLDPGRWLLTISNHTSFKQFEILPSKRITRYFKIVPNISYALFCTLLVGSAFGSLLFQLLISRRLSIILTLIPLAPLLIIKTQSFVDSFEVIDSEQLPKRLK